MLPARCPQLPLLPGNNFNHKIGQTRFHKSQHFGNVHNLSMLLEKQLPGIGGEPMSQTVHSRWPSIYCRGDVSTLPAWLAFDKETLVFDAYFQEALQEIEGSPFLPRFVKIYFFLEDGTIQVQEPRKPNSGVHQGVFISRQRIRFPPDSRSDQYVDIVDLNVGNQIELYGRVFKIVNCDRFTRNFLNRLGISVPDPICSPEDPYLQRRDKVREGQQAKKPKKVTHDETQFLKYDRQVLRFYGYWDDRQESDGVLHRVVLLYFLADDTIEVRDVIPPNAGRTGSVLLSRSRLPKEFTSITSPGCYDNFTVLNVLGQSAHKRRLIFDSLNCGSKPITFYKQTDLAIGAMVNVYGRSVMLCDCDEYTKEYYRKNYGLESFTPHPYPMDDDTIFEGNAKLKLPPYNGYGTYEDSANNCRTIHPVAPVKDLKQFLRKDKEGLDSRILRFTAQMISSLPNISKRPFIISYFLADDTMNVFENVRINSGFAGGMFFGREKFIKPGEEEFGSNPPAYYTKDDIYVGAQIVLRDFKFLITDADEYALRYMELHCGEFPKSNVRQIMHKVRERVRPIYKQFIADMFGPAALKEGIVHYKTLRRALLTLLRDEITEQEIITVARAYRIEVKPPPDCENIRRHVHVDLKRFLFNSFERLAETFKHLDAKHTGMLSRKDIYASLRGARVPLDVQLLNAMLDCIPVQEGGLLNYNDVLKFLDYERYSAPPAEPAPLRRDLCWMSHAPKVDSSIIGIDAFLRELNLEADLQETCVDPEPYTGAVVPVPKYSSPPETLYQPPENCNVVLRRSDM